jgi:hypothetical protein
MGAGLKSMEVVRMRFMRKRLSGVSSSSTRPARSDRLRVEIESASECRCKAGDKFTIHAMLVKSDT